MSTQCFSKSNLLIIHRSNVILDHFRKPITIAIFTDWKTLQRLNFLTVIQKLTKRGIPYSKSQTNFLSTEDHELTINIFLIYNLCNISFHNMLDWKWPTVCFYSLKEYFPHSVTSEKVGLQCNMQYCQKSRWKKISFNVTP